MTTSKPVSELACRLAQKIEDELLDAELGLDDPKELEIYIRVLEEMAALTRKQTIEECARTAEKFAGNCNWSVACLVNERIAAAIREMEVKA